ncbi:MAG: DUF3592 domain-containing protein [Chloroflexi bacterium]|nr:DUF3592 domain-containing protein [Chloroflexota bacterium]
MSGRNTGMGCLGTILFVGIFIAVGIGLFIWGLNVLQKAQASQDWPTADGTIISATVREDRDDDGTSYFADVTYQYTAADRRHSSDNVSFGQYGGSSRHAEGIVARYPVGQRVTVYYDPDDPMTAVLEPGANFGSYLLVGMGALFIGVALLVGLFSLFGILRRR